MKLRKTVIFMLVFVFMLSQLCIPALAASTVKNDFKSLEVSKNSVYSNSNKDYEWKGIALKDENGNETLALYEYMGQVPSDGIINIPEIATIWTIIGTNESGDVWGEITAPVSLFGYTGYLGEIYGEVQVFESYKENYKIKKFTIPKTVTDISSISFDKCSNVEEYAVDEENVFYLSRDGVMYDKGLSKLIFYPPAKKSDIFLIPETVTEIGKSSFKQSQFLKSINIPSSVEIMGTSAFQESQSLENVTFQEGLTEIPEQTFSDCINLKNVIIPNTVEIIGMNAFSNCSSLEYIDLPDNLKSIKAEAFAFCTNLDGVVFPEGLESIYEFAFAQCHSLSKIDIPNSLKTLEMGAFTSCTSFKTLVIPEGFNAINYGVFSDCTSLTYVSLPSTLRFIDASAFSYCKSLTSIKLPEMLEEIGQAAFACTALERIVIPDNVKIVGVQAFAANPNLSKVVLGKEVEIIDFNAFSSCEKLDKMVIPENVYGMGDSVFAWNYNMKGLYFLGDAPESFFGFNVFHETDPDFKIYYLEGTKGWKNPWHDIPTQTFTYTPPVEYMLNITSGNGGQITGGVEGMFEEGEKTTVRATSNLGYRFVRWESSNDGTFINSYNTTTVFTMPKNETTIKAIFEKISDDEDYDPNPTPAPTPDVPQTDNNDNGKIIEIVVKTEITDNGTKAEVSEKALLDAILKAQSSLTNENSIIQIKIESSQKIENIIVSAPSSALKAIADNPKLSLSISTPIATILFDSNAIEAIIKEASGMINFKLSIADINSISIESEYKDIVDGKIGNRPVYDFSITSGDKSISEFGKGNVQVNIPYELANNEKSSKIVIYYINDNGEISIVKNCKYNEKEKILGFTSNHFSKYAVGYNNLQFSDINEHEWYSDSVDFVSSRMLFSGKDENKFAPNEPMTRAMFVTVLGRLHDADVSGKISSFDDVDRDQYYSGYVAWAVENKIVNGVGNNKFDPNAPITREEMAAIIANYAEFAEISLEGDALNFADNSEISSYARNAVAKMYKAGIMQGVGENNFDPKGQATRAQVSKVLMNYISFILE